MMMKYKDKTIRRQWYFIDVTREHVSVDVDYKEGQQGLNVLFEIVTRLSIREYTLYSELHDVIIYNYNNYI